MLIRVSTHRAGKYLNLSNLPEWSGQREECRWRLHHRRLPETVCMNKTRLVKLTKAEDKLVRKIILNIPWCAVHESHWVRWWAHCHANPLFSILLPPNNAHKSFVLPVRGSVLVWLLFRMWRILDTVEDIFDWTAAKIKGWKSADTMLRLQRKAD